MAGNHWEESNSFFKDDTGWQKLTTLCDQRPDWISPMNVNILKTNPLSIFIQHVKISRYPNLKMQK